MAANPYPAFDGVAPETLEDRLADGALPLSDAIRFSIALAEALREIHRQGRVYGLLQPGGIAVIEDQLRFLPAGPSALTAYFSPEQVSGNDLDWRSDIFSLGALMYEMFSGRRAFRATTRPALRMEILNRDSAMIENIPTTLGRLIQRCLEKKPERRIQRMEILLAELKLQYALAGNQSEWRPAPAPAPAAETTQALVLAPRPALRPVPPPAAAVREKLDFVCPNCGTRDVYTSRPRGPMEAMLSTAGMSVARCYRCYHRFLRVGAFTFKKQ